MQDRGRFGQTISVVMNEGQERMHGVDKMDAERNSQERKLEIWKEFEWRGLMRTEKIMVLDLG